MAIRRRVRAPPSSFTLILGLLSRWSGGLLDRLGPRLPLIAGPGVTALGLLLLALPGAGGAYWTTFFLPMLIIGFGMAVTVAPLTATVLNAVAARQTGTASGINNAVASVASLLAVAVLGTIAISTFDRSLDRHLDVMGASAEVRHSVDAMRGGFVARRSQVHQRGVAQPFMAWSRNRCSRPSGSSC